MYIKHTCPWNQFLSFQPLSKDIRESVWDAKQQPRNLKNLEIYVKTRRPKSPLRCVQTCCSSNNYLPHCMSASVVQTGMLSPHCEQCRHPSRPLSTSTAPNNTSVLTEQAKISICHWLQLWAQVEKSNLSQVGGGFQCVCWAGGMLYRHCSHWEPHFSTVRWNGSLWLRWAEDEFST